MNTAAPSYLIDPSGGYKLIDFEFGDGTESYHSCSVQWHNHFYVFGGYSRKRQVSMVNDKRLEPINTDLDFDFWWGGCTVVNQRTIVLCFDAVEKDVCRKSNNPLGSFTKLPNSTYDHGGTHIASFDGKNKVY